MKKLLASVFALSLLVVFSNPLAAKEDEKKKRGERKRPDPAELFKKLDKDSDGKVTKEEFAARGGRKGQDSDDAKKRIEEFFKRLDKNGDGSLSLDEFKSRPPRGAGDRKKRDGERKKKSE